MKSVLRAPIYFASALSLFAGTITSLPSGAQTSEKSNSIVLKKDEIAKPITFFEGRDPKTQEKIELQFQPTPREQLLKYVPPRLTPTEGVPPSKGFTGASKQLAVDFIPEFLAFTIALSLSSTIHYDNSPNYLKNFREQNLSWIGAGSFAGFLVGARSAQAMMQWSGLAYDPRRSPLELSLRTPLAPSVEVEVPAYNYKNEQVGSKWATLRGQPEYFKTASVLTPAPPTFVQRVFSPLSGPLGLAAGMIVSNTIHEIVADKNLQLCAMASYRNDPLPTDPALAKEMQTQIDLACERAWEDWKLSKKAMDYTPDMLSLLGPAFLQAYAATPAIKWVGGKTGRLATAATNAFWDSKGVGFVTGKATQKVLPFALKQSGERFIPFALQAVRVGKFFGSFAGGWQMRVAMTAGNILVFMELSHLMPNFKAPFERWRQGDNITGLINTTYIELGRAEKNKWVWAPATAPFCEDGSSHDLGVPYMNFACPESAIANQFPPAYHLKKMAQRQAKWREFILTEAYAAHTAWQGYVTEFATMYANARTFYGYVISLARFKTLKPGSEESNDLYTAAPYHGMYTDPAVRGGDGAALAIASAREWLKEYMVSPVYAKVEKSTSTRNETQVTGLKQILNALNALDPEYPVSMLGAPEFSIVRDNSKLTKQALGEIEARVRNRVLADGVAKLLKILKDDPYYNDKSAKPNTTDYEIDAQSNPFMMLRKLLGDPEPLARGVALIRGLNDAESVIAQASKYNSPGWIGHFETRTMTEFLTASMICGPDIENLSAEPKRYSDEEKIKIYRDRKMSFVGRVLSDLGLGKRGIRAEDKDVLIAVNEQIDEDQDSKDKSLFPTYNAKTVTTQWRGWSADFHPPRIVTGVPDSVCRELATNKRATNNNLQDIFSPKWTFGGTTYVGLLDILRKHIRQDLIGKTLPPADKKAKWDDPFLAWWSAKTDTHIEAMVLIFRKKYREILKDKYIPALTLRGDDAVKMYNGRPFKLGALESLYDEGALYLDVLGKIAHVSKDAKTAKAYTDLSATIMLQFRNMGGLVSDLETVEKRATIAKSSYDTQRAALDKSLTELKTFVETREKANSATKDMTDSDEQALRNMTALLGEMDSYWGIIRSIQISTEL